MPLVNDGVLPSPRLQFHVVIVPDGIVDVLVNVAVWFKQMLFVAVKEAIGRG